MAVAATLNPIPAKDFGFAQARHLINRAGFGGTPQQVHDLQRKGLKKAVDSLVDYEKISVGPDAEHDFDADIIRPLTPDERQARRQAIKEGNKEVREKLRKEFLERRRQDRLQMRDIGKWWLQRMINTPRPLQEKLVLLWHNHFATSYRTVQDSWKMLQQNAMFRKHANGHFGNLAMGIIHDPAMLRFLNNNQNRKGSPNENLARELMELFTLGEGYYTEADIREGARALTGYTYKDDAFYFQEDQHDDGMKTILGQTGAWDGEDFVRILLTQRACSRFIAYKLYDHFVADISQGETEAATRVIDQLASVIRKHKYQLKPALTALFMSRHFYDPAIMGNQVKSPVQLVVGTVRMLDTPTRQVSMLQQALNTMGQQLFAPPSVAGWDGGRSWINTSTLFVRQNTATYLITGKRPNQKNWNSKKMGYDPMPLVESLLSNEPRVVVDHLLDSMIAVPVAEQRRAALAQVLEDSGGEVNRDALAGLLVLITALPEYQLC